MNGLEESLVDKWCAYYEYMNTRASAPFALPIVTPPELPFVRIACSHPAYILHSHSAHNTHHAPTRYPPATLPLPTRRSAGWNHESHEFHVSDKLPDYAHADPCRQEKRSVYVFDLFVSRPSAPDLSTKLSQLGFKAQAAPQHLTEVSVGVFFEQAFPLHISSTASTNTPHHGCRPTNHPNHTRAPLPHAHAHALSHPSNQHTTHLT